jgi:soluble lytic murein transglycosylase
MSFPSRAAPLALLTASVSLAVTLGARPQYSPGPGTPGPEGLVPTMHPPLPAVVEDFWLVPRQKPTLATERQRAYDALVRAVALIKDDKVKEGLILLDPATLDGTPLSSFGHFVRGKAQMALQRPAEARQSFESVRRLAPSGFLAFAATYGLAQAAEQLGEAGAAADRYAEALPLHPERPDEVRSKLWRVQLAAGRRTAAWVTLRALYYEDAGSEFSFGIKADLDRLANELGRPTRGSFQEELARAERLFRARRYADARDAFEALEGEAPDEARPGVAVRLAASLVSGRRYTTVPTLLQPYLSGGAHEAEARHWRLLALRGLGRTGEYIVGVRGLVDDHPQSPWSEAALNELGTFHIRQNEDGKAADVFREMADRFPGGAHAERAAWRYGWWSYRNGAFAETARVFERGATSFPRSDYRPAFLYWSGRAYEALGQASSASARYRVAVIDYGTSYYGRLAATRVRALPALPASTQGAGAAAGFRPTSPGPNRSPEVTTPPGVPETVADRVRVLLSLDLYDDALDELRYARRAWGESPALRATTAWAYHRQGELRLGINLMKQAYPHYLTAEGVNLPLEVQRVIYPLDYWDLIQRHASDRGLDPYLLAALIAQESTFSPTIKSSANAYGLMQILPSTGRQLARSEGMRPFRTRMLTNPDTNLRLGTAHLAKLIARFGEIHLALAGYNAGDSRVRAWLSRNPGVDADEFIDDIPFPETQNYVKRILGTADDYRRLYGAQTAPTGDAAEGVAEDDQ